MKPDLKNVFTLLLLALIWGSSFILMKRVIMTSDLKPLYSPLALGSMRLSLAGLVLLPISISRFSKLEKKHIPAIAVVGMVGNGIPAFLFAIAQTRIPSSLSGVLNSLTPLFVVILGVMFFQLKLNKKILLGVLVGLLGAAGLVLFQKGANFNLDSETLLFSGLILIATCCYGLSVNTIDKRLKKVDHVAIASIGLGLASIPGIVILPFTNFQDVILNHSQGLNGLGFCFLLSVIGTAFALILFNRLVQKSSAIFASMVTYLIPIVAVIWGVLDGESFSLIQVLLAGLILLGVYFVKLGRKNSSQ